MKNKSIFSKFRFYTPTLISLFLLILFCVAFFINRILYIVYPGHAGVHWSFFSGTEIENIYSEGFHLILPCDKLYIYDVRIQEISDELEVLSKTGLKINIFLSIRFRPKYKFLGLLHQNIGLD
ncbi:MAG: hypothetical protein HQK75_17450 [Candidatus Magnetomorum sp.]|nr:hypothetical protein [Candidatus Magnetomorum sp.]